MYYFAVGFGVWLHVFFWGAGLAILAMPRPWRAFWPVLAWPAGLALQSVVVWLGAHAGFRGTDAYAVWSEALPLGLAWLAWRRRGARAVGDCARFAGLGALMGGTLAVLLSVLAQAARGLTTVSLGSFDAADYAAGARVFKEFAHSDRGGFLGLTEVVRVASVDNVFDFWLRLNHFTPSALIALNGTIVDCQPHELTGIMTAVLLVASLPVVFWCARAVLGFRGGVALWATALYGFGPVTWYAVFHVAMGQLLAAMAIGLVTWAGVALWRGRLTLRRAVMFFGVLGIGYGLIWGSYNFIVLVCLVPAVAYAGGLALATRAWVKFGYWLAAMLVPLLACGGVFWTRVSGLIERFLLFRQYDFGWRVPVLTPEGWLGVVGDDQLNALPNGVRIALAAAVAAGLIVAFAAGARRRPRAVYAAVCLLVPALVGYAYLNLRGHWLGTQASYDAYKILAVFYPGLLPAAVFWAEWGWSRGRFVRAVVLVAMGAVLVGNLRVARLSAARLEFPPFGVTRELIELRALETQPEIGSVNVLMSDGWSRLWANAQLLRIPQYFDTHTYEGRLNTALRGRWDLIGGVIEIVLPDGGSRPAGSRFTLVDTRSDYFVRVRFGSGWHEVELPFSSPAHWRWTKGEGELRVENPHGRPLATHLRLTARALETSDVELWVNGQPRATVRIGPEVDTVGIPSVTLPPGETRLELRSGSGTAAVGDARTLGVAFYRIAFDVQR